MTAVMYIDKKNWGRGIAASQNRYQLAGPVKEKAFHTFRRLKNGELPDMAYKSTRLSPKSILFPQSEIMFTFDLGETAKNPGVLAEVESNNFPCAVIGIRPYDAKAFQIMKLNFDAGEYQDPYWLNAFEQSTFIGLAVNEPESVDFSMSCGTGPFDESGLDVLLADCKDHYLAKVLTEKGHAWMKAAGFTTVAPETALQTWERMREAAESAITSKVSFDRIRKMPVADLYQAPFWEDAAFGCIHCGACTFACPTCGCFDIQDEKYGHQGIRMRNWDSCMSPLFTRHASGHDPRPTGLSRTRQRFMHKLKYFLDKHDQGIMCVGCGRCVVQCPANIDIREICDRMNRHEIAKGECS
jgi:sulfhydrogenase subunit beta (sulfur reductase)